MTSLLNIGGKLQAGAAVQLQKECDKLYKNTTRLKAECGSLITVEEETIFLNCCLSQLGVISTL